ncbi:MAG: hypothetical protein AVDCRST_MAG93-2545, partial [uncultured Chloroflexia bacterium]
ARRVHRPPAALACDGTIWRIVCHAGSPR